jgi:hypothetical protein
VLQEHVLRSSYEYLEQAGSTVFAETTPIPISALPSVRRLPLLVKGLFFLRLAHSGQSKTIKGEGIVLTEKGLQRGKELTINHRLWEHYLAKQDSVLLSHVDYSADLVEHVLSPILVAELRRELAGISDVDLLTVPTSLHPMGDTSSEEK